MTDQLQPVIDALQNGDKSEARDLLEPLLADAPSADAYYLAARAAETANAAVHYLQQALALDPEHAQAKPLMAQLAAYQPLPAAPAETPPPTAPAAPLESTAPGTPAAPPAQPPSREAVERASAVAVERQEDGKRVTVEGVYEMLWDCKYCGRQKNLGKTHRFCPNCGAAQDPSWRYFPSDAEKVAVHDHAYVGVDVTCPACGTTSSPSAKFCGRCGSPLKEGAQVAVQAAREAAGSGGFQTEDVVARMNALSDAAVGRVSAPQTQQRRGGGINRTGILIGLVVLAVLAGVMYTLFATREAGAFATGFRWEREISIERLSPVSGRVEGTCSSAPLGAYNTRQTEEQVDTRQVPDGETCTNRQVDQGDGTFRTERVCETRYRSEPVYGPVCYYTVNLWQVNRSATAEGTRDTDPYWPQTNVDNCQIVGCEREGSRNERYVLQLRANTRDFECVVARDLWDQTRLEDAFTLQFGRVLNDARCNTLQRGG